MIDPRQGLPSGSSALEDSLCRGRFHAQKAWAALSGELDQDDSPEADQSADGIDADAESGKRIHMIYSGAQCPEATLAEVHRAQSALQVDVKKKREWLESFSDQIPVVPVETVRERRWWLKNGEGKNIYSGQTDVVWFRGNPGGVCDILVADLKGLWGAHDPASTNMQIRRYIALIAATIQDNGYSEVRSAAAYLNQPAVTMDPRMVLYTQEDIQSAVLEMYLDVEEILNPDAKKTPGPVQCRRCKGKLICEEWLAFSRSLPVISPVERPVPDKKELTTRVAAMTDGDLQNILPWLPALENFVTLAESEAKRRLKKDPNSLPLYWLKPNSPRSKVTDAKLVFTRLAEEFGVPADEFTAAASVSKEACEKMVRAHSELVGKALEEKLRQLFEGATTPTPVGPSLKPKEL